MDTKEEQVNFKKEDTNSILDALLIAIYSGIPAMYLAYPCKSIEKRVQLGYPVTLNPLILYRGSLAYVISFVLTCMTSYGINAGLFGGKIKKDGELETTIRDAILSGILSGVVAVPAENIIVRQQSKKLKLWTAIRELFKEGSAKRFFRSYFLISLREAIYCPTNLIFVERIGYFVDKKYHNPALTVGSEIGASIIPAVFSHPVERTATALQKDLSLSIKDGFKMIYSRQGLAGFFKGILGRAGLFAVVTPAMVILRGPISTQVEKKNYNFVNYPFSFWKEAKDRKNNEKDITQQSDIENYERGI